MATKKSAPAKYADKSADQPGLQTIFNTLHGLISAYQKGNFTAKSNKAGQYELYYDKAVEMAGKKYPELAFASLLIQKGYVGFYFFPVYVDEQLKNKIAPDLLKTLKGKTCFHIKKEDPALFEHIKQALLSGYNTYQKRGWK